MPGTVGTLAGLPLFLPALLNPELPRWIAPAAGLFLSLLLGALAIPPVLKASGMEDPSFVVIDEVAGMAAALCLCPPTLLHAGFAFVLFRILDIWKPFPIGRLERLPGWWGIMADDLLAGFLAGAVTLLPWGSLS